MTHRATAHPTCPCTRLSHPSIVLPWDDPQTHIPTPIHTSRAEQEYRAFRVPRCPTTSTPPRGAVWQNLDDPESTKDVALAEELQGEQAQPAKRHRAGELPLSPRASTMAPRPRSLTHHTIKQIPATDERLLCLKPAAACTAAAWPNPSPTPRDRSTHLTPRWRPFSHLWLTRHATRAAQEPSHRVY